MPLERPSRKRFCPCIDRMEDRTLLSTFLVKNTDDSGPGSLRAAILSANVSSSPSTIDFANGLRGTIRLTSGELLINGSITINGPGSNVLAISGNQSSRVFEVATGQNVTISALTISDGSAPDQGGGILNDGSNLTLSGDDLARNVTYESTTTQAQGGGLQSLGGTLTITNCLITGNQAQGGTGDSAFGDSYGGGISVAGGTATISCSQISDNQAIGGAGSGDGLGGGGGIYSLGPVSISGSTISNNVARGGDMRPIAGPMGAVSGSSLRRPPSQELPLTATRRSEATAGQARSSALPRGANQQLLQPHDHLEHFINDQALGGSGGNSGTSDEGPYVDYGFGGAIATTEASMTISGSTFLCDKAVGGNHSTATDTSDIVGAGGAEGGAFTANWARRPVSQPVSLHATWLRAAMAIQAIDLPAVLVGEGLGGAMVSGFGGSP